MIWVKYKEGNGLVLERGFTEKDLKLIKKLEKENKIKIISIKRVDDKTLNKLVFNRDFGDETVDL